MRKKNEEEKTKAIDGVVYEFTPNKHGVSIKKCCASCQTHEPLDSDGPRRLCTKHDKPVDKSDCCDDWSMSDAINRIKLRK